MKNILESMEYVDDEMIREAEEYVAGKNKKTWIKYIPVAACFCLVAFVGFRARQTGLFVEQELQLQNPSSDQEGVINSGEHGDNHAASQDNGEQAAAAQTQYRIYTNSVQLPETIPDDVEMDMIGGLVYKGKVYTQSETYYYDDPDFDRVEQLVGECVGEAKGTLDEWSSQEEWATEFASTYSGPVYKVKGYSEDFRLCVYIIYEEGKAIQFLDNYDGIGLNTGADLFEERLHVAGNIDSITYRTHCDWNEGDSSNIRDLTAVTREQFESFLEELYNSPFERIDYETNMGFYHTPIQGHLELKMKDGTYVEMRLIDGGYVGCQDLAWVYVKMPGELFDLVLSACQ